MDKKIQRKVELIFCLISLVLASATFQVCFSAATQPPSNTKNTASALYPITGNVYPLGYYAASIKIGNPPRPFELDIDTGSDLTWVQCDAPCTGCTMPPASLYKPNHNVVPCSRELCPAVAGSKYRCPSPDEQCDYEVAYADKSSSLGVLVVDYFPLNVVNGSLDRPRLIFG